MSADLFDIGRPQKTCDRCGRPNRPEELKYALGYFLCYFCRRAYRRWVQEGEMTKDWRNTR